MSMKRRNANGGAVCKFTTPKRYLHPKVLHVTNPDTVRWFMEHNPDLLTRQITKQNYRQMGRQLTTYDFFMYYPRPLYLIGMPPDSEIRVFQALMKLPLLGGKDEI